MKKQNFERKQLSRNEMKAVLGGGDDGGVVGGIGTECSGTCRYNLRPCPTGEKLDIMGTCPTGELCCVA